MALLKMKLDGEKYEVDLDKLTLGEHRTLKHEYGMEDISTLSFFDPDQLTGLFVIAVMRAHPEMSKKEAIAKVEGLQTGPIFEEINKQLEAAIKKAQAEEADPPRAGASASAPAAKTGKRGTTRKTRGTPH